LTVSLRALVSRRMPRRASFRRLIVLPALVCGLAAAAISGAATGRASGPQGFSTVVIDAGHGGIDRGGGPGQILPEKPYTLDTALRLERALRARGVHTVMTRTGDYFVPLPERVMIGSTQGNAIFVSIHFNSAPREEAHGIETYYYRPDSFGLAARLHRAQLASLDTIDRNIRRRGFFVLRKSGVPAVLCEGGYLTNAEESRVILSDSYRERWAQNVADAIVAQQRYGDPADLGRQPPVTTEVLVANGRTYSRHVYTTHSSRRHTSSHHVSSKHTTSAHTSSRHKSSSTTKSKSKRRHHTTSD
jgi:N-acetylmuramoyl-L-alanine amidase